MAGFFGFFDYTKPGKGVDENAPPKRRIIVYFEVLFRKFWKLIQLNLLYLIAIIPNIIIYFFISAAMLSPIFSGQNAPEGTGALFLTFSLTFFIIALWGAGPVTAGLVYILRNYSREEHSWVWSDFWEHTRQNFKQAICVFLIDLAALILFYVSYNFYSQSQGIISYLKYLLLIILVLYTIIHMYIYPMMVTFKLSLRDLYRNCLLFAMARLPQNVLMLAVIIALSFGVMYNLITFIILIPLLLFSLCAYTTVFWVYPTLKKHMIKDQQDEVK